MRRGCGEFIGIRKAFAKIILKNREALDERPLPLP
jgi:hypothetical protein